MWNVPVQKKWDSFKWHLVWVSEKEELIVWGSGFLSGLCGAMGSGLGGPVSSSLACAGAVGSCLGGAVVLSWVGLWVPAWPV